MRRWLRVKGLSGSGAESPPPTELDDELEDSPGVDEGSPGNGNLEAASLGVAADGFFSSGSPGNGFPAAAGLGLASSGSPGNGFPAAAGVDGFSPGSPGNGFPAAAGVGAGSGGGVHGSFLLGTHGKSGGGGGSYFCATALAANSSVAASRTRRTFGRDRTGTATGFDRVSTIASASSLDAAREVFVSHRPIWRIDE